MWTLQSRGVLPALHYLDGFLLSGPPGSTECQTAVSTLEATCSELGLVPVAYEKTESPSTVITFLGIEIDTTASQLRLP